MKKQLIFGLGFLFTSFYSAAQQTILDSVIIRENRIQTTLARFNRNIAVLDKKQIAALPVKSVNELLSYVSGADLRQRGPNGTQSDISIDGSTFEQVLILINGVKMSDPQTGHHLMNLPIPLSSIEQIEILHGPAAMKYGVNALAGAINIVTRMSRHNQVSAQVYAASNIKTDSTTGNTYYGWGAQASASLAGKKQGHVFSIAHDEGNGYRYNTGFNAYRLYYQNKFELDKKNSIEAMGGYIYNDFGAKGFYSAPKDANSKETVQTAMGNIAYTFAPNDKLKLYPRVSYRYNNDDYIFIRQNPSYYHNTHETNVLTGEVQSSYQLKNGTIGAGVEYRNEGINSSNLGKRSRNNTGIYAEYKHNFSTKLNAGTGLYASYNSDYGWQVFPGVDAGYLFSPEWKVYANASTGQRLPTYTDLYYKGPLNIGNENLKPEQAAYAECGLQYNHNLIFVHASYFYRRTTDFIDWVRVLNTDPWQPQNYQSINTQGVTVQAKYDMGKHLELSDNFRLGIQAGYTYLNPEVKLPTIASSKYTIEALRHQLITGIHSTLFGQWQASLNGRYLCRISANDYTLLDAKISYAIKNWFIYADVNNILDTQYKEIGTVQLPGRWYTLGVLFNARM